MTNKLTKKETFQNMKWFYFFFLFSLQDNLLNNMNLYNQLGSKKMIFLLNNLKLTKKLQSKIK